MKFSKDDEITGIPVVQNQQEFIVAIFSISQILKYTKYTSRLIVDYDETEEPIYNKEIQREVESSRVEKIADFLINDPEATFPTNIVLHIPRKVILKQTEADGLLKIQLNHKLFEEIKKGSGHVFISIIDGQHRIRGIEIAIERLNKNIESLVKTLATSKSKELEERLSYYQERLGDLVNIEIMVSFFIDKTLEYQAMIFSTINRTQKRVSPSLVFSLFGLDTRDTPQKTALQVVFALSTHKKSPFYKRIKLYGGAYDNESPPLSQASMVRSIISLISENLRESENDRFKPRKALHKRSESSQKFLPFRKYYASDRDKDISDIMFFYFGAVRDVFLDKDGHSYWEFNDDGMIENIFQSTVGYDSLLKILVDILEKDQLAFDQALKNDTNAEKLNFFAKHLKKSANLKISDLTRYSLNNRGKRILYLDISLKIFPPNYKVNPKDGREEELADLLKP